VGFALAGALIWLLIGCGESGPSRREFVETESYGADVSVQAFRVFAGSRVSVFVGIESCSAPIGSEVTWMTVSVPADATPGEYDVDVAAPADPAPGTATATVTIAELTATVGDQALGGYVGIDSISGDRVTGLADVDFPDGRMAVRLDAGPCL
jgi:hypothetical protein